jgi:hypothetical protein
MNVNRLMTVNFHGTALYASTIKGTVFVALKPMVEAMGLAWQGQLERIKRHPTLSEGISVMLIPTPQGPQNSVGIRLNLVPGWLFTISTLRIKSAQIRASVQLFQRECFDVLWEHFSGQRQPEHAPTNEYERLSVALVNEARLTFGIRAAAQIWEQRGLPRVPAMAELFKQGDLFDRLEHHAA